MTTTQITTKDHAPSTSADREFVTFIVGDHLFGVPVLRVQDILVTDAIASVPLAPREIRGSINLRGRIVTVLDVRARLGLPDRREELRGRAMGVTVERGHDLYTLLVDSVGDVVTLSPDGREPNPSSLDAVWNDVVEGVYRHNDRLLVVLDTDKFLNIQTN